MIVKKREHAGLKLIDNSLALLSGLYQDKEVIIEKVGHVKSGIKAKLIKQGNEFIINSADTISLGRAYKRNAIKKIFVLWNKERIILERIFVKNFFAQGFEADVGDLSSKEFSNKKKQYNRLIIPLKRKLYFFNIIEQRTFETETFRSRNCVRASFNNYDLDIYTHNWKGSNNYLIIDCSQKMSNDDFSEYSFACLVSVGYLTGDFIQDEGVYFTYGNKEMKIPVALQYSSLRPTIHSIHHPVNANPFGFGVKGQKAERLSEIMKPVSEEQFSKLCLQVYEKADLRAALLMMMEALKGSIFTTACVMAVILEALTNLFAKENPEYSVYIKDPKVTSGILKELKAVISLHATQLGNLQTILVEKINQINQVSNKTKLIKPFEMLGFTLNENDNRAINRRNDLLHGRLSLNFTADQEMADRELYFIAIRLYTLINILILKQAGYSGYIINWTVFNKHVHGIDLKEEVFRKI